jgi:pyruvate ferredoxin oxidoreductase beta subunit
VYEKKGDEPGYFGIFIDPTKCKGCAECVEACGDHGALRMLEEETTASLSYRSALGISTRKMPPTPEVHQRACSRT